MRIDRRNVMALGISSIALVFIFSFQNMVPVSLIDRFDSSYRMSGSTCYRQPTNSSLKVQMKSGGLTDIEIMSHIASRLGYGASPIGKLTLNQANDCTTSFYADEIMLQISNLGSNVDSPELYRIRQGIAPLSIYAMSDLDNPLVAWWSDPSATTAAGYYQWQMHEEVPYLQNLRGMLGSQVRLSDGSVVDYQLNLEDVMGEFWFNHFNVSTSKSGFLFHGNNGYIETIRRTQGSTFYNILSAVFKQPAMLIYLDNQDNRAICNNGLCTASNQNLGRELLELHTLGIGPKQSASDSSSPYGQTDVENAALILAGWNARYTSQSFGTNESGFVYNSALAAPINVIVMGRTYAPGASRVETLLRDLANHAQTKNAVCKKLATKLFASSLITAGQSACVSAWGTDGNIKAMLQAMLSTSAFWSRTNYRAIYRNPIELTLSLGRAQGINIVDVMNNMIAEGLDASRFDPRYLTPSGYVNTYTTYYLPKRSISFINGFNQQIVRLGHTRGDFNAPTGYPTDTSNLITSSFIDESSRSAHATSVLFWLMQGSNRSDLMNSNIVNGLWNDVGQLGYARTQQKYLETTAKIGGIYCAASPCAPAPYRLPASQQSLLSSIVNDQNQWVVLDGWRPIEYQMNVLPLASASQLMR